VVGYPAGLGRRLGALLYDTLLVIAIWAFSLFLWLIPNGGEAVINDWVTWVLGAQWVGFYLIFWSRQGQTLGMQAWRIRLVSTVGTKPTLKQLLQRLLCAPVSMACAGFGFLWLYVGDARQTWHDRLSHTVVVHLPKE